MTSQNSKHVVINETLIVQRVLRPCVRSAIGHRVLWLEKGHNRTLLRLLIPGNSSFSLGLYLEGKCYSRHRRRRPEGESRGPNG
jgi:hypothetical protein